MKKYIEKWLKEGLISSQQAKQMYSDIDKDSSEKSSRNLIVTFSTIGAVLAGIGCILFVAANWQAIPSFIKVLALTAITFSCALGGYYLQYENKNYPKTGASLLFLSTILFGALIFLTAQVYNINSSEGTYVLVFIWFIAILPFTYIFYSRPVAMLVSVLFTLCFSLFIFQYNNMSHMFKALPVLYCAAGIFLYCFGKINEFIKGFYKVAAVYEKTGIFIMFFGLFFITFSYFTNPKEAYFFDFITTWKFLHLRALDIMLLSSLLMFLFSFFANPAKKNNAVESYMVTAIFVFMLFMVTHTFIPRIFANLLFAVMVLSLVYAGYVKKEAFYVNLGIFWLIIFIAVKYFDVFWKLLPRSFFFLAGGIILVSAALFFEHKRRKINAELKTYES